jgi:hypothetical protein
MLSGNPALHLLLAAGVARSTLTDYRPYKKAAETLIIQSDSTMMQRADRIARGE